jgi:hypothetical protein
MPACGLGNDRLSKPARSEIENPDNRAIVKTGAYLNA